MNIFKKTYTPYIFAFTIFFLVSFFFIGYKTIFPVTRIPNKETGIFDYQNINFDSCKILAINGNVEFYENQLLTPADFKDSTNSLTFKPIKIPGTWNNTIDTHFKHKAFGYGTYHFRILVPADTHYIFKIGELNTAYKIFINGEIVTQNGRVGKSKSEMRASWRKQLAIFDSKEKEIDVVLQISNFQHRNGGLTSEITFGKAKYVASLKRDLIGLEFFLLGILFIMAFYHLTIFIFRPQQKEYFFFTIICLLLSARLLTTGEEILSVIFPNISWYISAKIEYISYMLSVPTIILYTSIFYKEINPIFTKIVLAIASIFTIIVLFTQPSFFTYTPIYYNIIITIESVYVLYILIKTIKKYENSFLFMISHLLFFSILINDVLYYSQIIKSFYLAPLGIFTMTFLQSIILSKSHSLTFIKLQELSARLELYNQELEATVETRTQFIVDQKNEILEQANQLKEANVQLKELSDFKESLTEMIIHDLKAPLNVVINYATDKRVIFAGTQLLNLVHNMLDVQRYENSKMKLGKEQLLLLELINSALYQLNFFIEEKSISVNIETLTDFQINADRDILSRVIVNLISNAVKFTPAEGKISISLIQKDNMAEFCVEDNGQGIPKENEKLIFEKFGQFVSKKAGRLGSTGLGLTFCKMAIEAHDGEIWFESIIGKGTKFYFTLPIDKTINSTQELSQKTINRTQELQLTKEEKQHINKIIEKFQDVEVYQIGKIKQQLSKLDAAESENISTWIKSVQNAIWNADQKRFNELIAQTSETKAPE